MGELTSPTVTSHGPVDCVSVGDVAVDDYSNPSLVRIHLRKSKTDQVGRGVDIYLGRTDDDLCPVAAFSGGFRNLERGVQPLAREVQPKTLGVATPTFGHVKSELNTSKQI